MHKQIMDLRTSLLYQVNLAVFLYFTNCHPGESAATVPVTKVNMLEAIASCDSVKFLRNSSYIKECNSISYPVIFTQDSTNSDASVMCVTLNHITNKICEYQINDKSLMKMPETAEKFDEEMKKLEPRHEEITKVVEGWCRNMTLLFNVSIPNVTNGFYVKQAKEILLDQTECHNTCQIRKGVNHFCVAFYWFNKLYNTLQSSKKINDPKETVVSQQEIHHNLKTDDTIEKQVIIGDNNEKQASVVTAKFNQEQPKVKLSDTETPNNAKAESLGSANEQEIKKDAEQSEISDREQQKQDSKLSSSTDDKLNFVDNKIENSKAEIQEANSDLLDEEAKKLIDEVAESENDHGGMMEPKKKDSFNDSGDQHGIFESPVIKEEDESHFFIYFSIISLICVMLYIGYHNKQKILAMVLEGRQSRRSRGSRRRPNTANYRKLDSNLEEAVTSQCNSNVTHVIY